MLVMTFASVSALARDERTLFQLGAVLGFALFMGVGLWSVKAQSEYLNLYRAKKDSTLPSNSDIAERYVHRPWAWLVNAPSLMNRNSRALSEPQDDPELEAARREVKRRERLVVVAMFASALIALMFGMVRV